MRTIAENTNLIELLSAGQYASLLGIAHPRLGSVQMATADQQQLSLPIRNLEAAITMLAGGPHGDD